MRVYLTSPELATEAGKQLLELTVRIAADGLIEPAEIDGTLYLAEEQQGE